MAKLLKFPNYVILAFSLKYTQLKNVNAMFWRGLISGGKENYLLFQEATLLSSDIASRLIRLDWLRRILEVSFF